MVSLLLYSMTFIGSAYAGLQTFKFFFGDDEDDELSDSDDSTVSYYDIFKE